MLTNAQALAALQRHEAKARRDDICFCVYSQKMILSIAHTPDQSEKFRYTWGPNTVERHTALRVVQTFEEAPKR